MAPTICLNMIVKNESKNLLRLFNSVLSIIDTYCICDTGSTDNTKEVIENYFKEKNIPGKIVEKEFVDFGTNRTYALHAAKGMADYALLLDADMILSIGPQFNKEKLADNDVYSILQGSDSFNYYNVRLLSLKLDVECVCPTHEYYSIKTNPHTHVNRDKTFLFIRDIGDGGCKSNKFQRDIQLLSKALLTEPNNTRYHFYLANSYLDTQQYENAIKHYKRHIELNSWDQEKYYSFYKLGKCYKALNDEANMVYYWIKGYSYRPTRAETLYELINYYRLKGENKLCELYYNQAKNIPYPKNDTLFIHKDVYDYKLDEEYTIFSFYTGNKNINDSVVKLFNDGRANTNLLLSNMKFYNHVISPIKTIDFSRQYQKELNGDKHDFNSSSSSIIKIHNNNYLMLIRCVNYKIVNNNEYIYKNYVINDYVKLVLDSQFNVVESDTIKYGALDYTKQTVGYDDIRLYNGEDDIVYTCGVGKHENNTTGVFIGTLTGNEFTSTNAIVPDFIKTDCEKNWVFCGENQVVYSWNPLRLCRVNEENKSLQLIREKPMPGIFTRARGSTCGFKYNNEIWFIVHIVSYEVPRYYYNMFAIFDAKMDKLLRYSAPFKFEGAPIEYCIGMIVEEDRVIIPYSTWDKTTKLAIYNKNYINELLVYKWS